MPNGSFSKMVDEGEVDESIEDFDMEDDLSDITDDDMFDL